MTDSRLILIGGGGHARVLLSTLRLQARTVLGFIDPRPAGSFQLGIPHLGGDDAMAVYEPDQILLINGIGSVDSTTLRRSIFEKFRSQGYKFEVVIHPSAVVAMETQIAAGAQIMAGAILQPGVFCGENSIVNTGARIDHDCRIEAHTHVAPGAILSGSVHVGTGAHIGTGAVVIQGVHVGSECVVGAGAVVIHDLPAGCTAVGVPARPLEKRRIEKPRIA